jgi:hypothetical protein
LIYQHSAIQPVLSVASWSTYWMNKTVCKFLIV